MSNPTAPAFLESPASDPRAFYRRELLAGISLAGVLLPESVAYAAIAGVEPMHALLAALIGLCVYPFLGTSRFAVVAPTSSAAAVFASATAMGGAPMGYALVGLTGLLFLLTAALKAGFLGAFISRPVLRGFAWALALTIVLKQLPHLTGLAVQASKAGPLVWELLSRATQWHGPSLALGMASLGLWLALHHGVRRWMQVPTSLLMLALAVALSLLLALRRFAQPLVSELGLLPGTRDYLDREHHPQTTTVPGTLIMRPEEPLFFANAEQVLHVVRQRAEAMQAQVVLLSLEVCDDLDSTAVETLAELAASLERQGTRLLLARVKDRPRQALIRIGLTHAAVGGVALFWSVDDAARAAAALTTPAAESSPARH